MKNERTLTLVALLCGAGAPLACSGGGAVNIGNTEVVGSQLSDYAANWDGYAEAYTFSPDGSDRVRLTIDASGQGTFRMGNATTLLAPPTDPNVGYPPGISVDGVNADGAHTGTREDFLYPIHAANVQEARIQLGIDPSDLYAAWCALQTPIPSYETTTVDGGASDTGTVSTFYSSCLPNVPSMSQGDNCALLEPDGSSTPVDCGKLYLCNVAQTCACTASGCTIPPQPADATAAQYPVEMDGALDTTGKMLTGTLTLNGQRITVHLTKQ
ncbi:MAG TPA: hypothetical protein VH853_03545 [Polyangia bacterium]|jgi:hypothetical protein|nr:hypothetical protein [Polyangia bacterium]